MRTILSSYLPSKKGKKKEKEDKKEQYNNFVTAMGNHLAKNGTANSSNHISAELQKKQGDRQVAYQTIFEALPENFKAKDVLFVGNNNFNMLVNDKKGGFSIQGSEMKLAQVAVLNKLSGNEGVQPSFLAKTYGESVTVKKANLISTKKTFDNMKDFNPGIDYDSTRTHVHVSKTEYFPYNFNQKVNETHAQSDPNLIADMTADFANQISNILSSIEKHNVVWTDLKPGNLLARDDNSLAIADAKGFIDMETLYLKERVENQGSFLSYPDSWATTPAYLSDQKDRLEAFPLSSPAKDLSPDEKLAESTAARTYFFDEWRKEYSYQMGLILYQSMVNKSDNEQVFIPADFDFTNSVFQTEKGQAIADIIQDLTMDDPNLRLSHEVAASKLHAISLGKESKITASTTRQSPTVSFSDHVTTISSTASMLTTMPSKKKDKEMQVEKTIDPSIKRVRSDSKEKFVEAQKDIEVENKTEEDNIDMMKP